jgi:hypothetical protein
MASLRIGDRDVLTVPLSGTVQAGNIIALLEELEARGPAAVLVDLTDLDVHLISPADIARMARRWASADRLRCAKIAVIASNPVVYGMNRMFQLVSNADGRLSVFWNRADAIDWLDESDEREGATS